MKFEPNNWSFHWHGRNKQGVSKWTGSVKPLSWIGRIFCVYGPIAGAGGLIVLLHALLTGHFAGGATTLMTVGFIHAAVFTSIGLWARSMHRYVSRLLPAEEISASLGLNDANLRELATQRNIRPRIILNEQPYYDPTEFVDALSLLRASSLRQASPETLLRPMSGSSELAYDELLRAGVGTQAEQSDEVGVDVQAY